MIRVEGLTAGYGGIVAIDRLSLSIAPGQMVAVIGANGAGKTTLVNTIAGLVPAMAGAVKLDDVALTNLPASEVARRGVLLVPEGRRILGPLTVEENLRLGHLAARSRGGSRVADMERVFALFPLLRERRQQAAGRLSGGQQQMLAIGRALMGRPQVLLLDEPSLGLAPVVVAQVFAALHTLHQDGLSILLIEQNARRALELAEYAYVMERGRFVRHGPSAELRQDETIVSYYLGIERTAVPGLARQEGTHAR
ncbi:MAG TPA: ABC transporter ATP-binding protein [Hyphomicrobiales bacterium]|nr:ABC transporter ATP-binding protein [Hyphomicrobiales bacterium]